MTLLLTDSEDSKDSEDSSDLATTPSQLIKSLSPVYCTVPVRVSDCVRSVPCEREGESLGSLRNIGEIDTIDAIDTIYAIYAIYACREDRWNRYNGGIDGGKMREGRSDVEHPSDICSLIGISSRLQLEQQLRER